jgi:hypothetical protein
MSVVDPTGAIVPGAKIDLESLLRTARGQSTSMFHGAADEQGEFRHALGQTAPTTLMVRVARPDDSAARTHALVLPPGLHGIWNAGELALLATRRLELRVQATDLSPIAAAQATPQPSQALSNARSDPQGRLEVSLGVDDDRLLVKALGYQSETLAVPADATALVAVLAKICLLEFQIADDDATDRNQLKLRVFGEPPIFSDDLPGAAPVLQVSGNTSRMKEPQGTASYAIGPDREDGRWKIAGLLPGIVLQAELSSPGGPVLAALDIAPLAPQEHRLVTLRLDRSPQLLRLRVLDPEQRPLPAAQVRLEDPVGRSARGARTDAEGRCEFNSLFGDQYTLTITAPDCAPRLVQIAAIPAEELTVILERPLRLDIELVEPDGQPMTDAGDVRIVVTPTVFVNAVRSAPGRWTADGLPSGEVTIEALNGKFQNVSQLHDMSVPTARLVVGHPGSVHATVVRREDAPSGEWSIAIAPLGSSRVLTRGRFSFAPNGSRDVWFNGLELGSYEVWLETRAPSSSAAWTRVGHPVPLTLDKAHLRGAVELRP